MVAHKPTNCTHVESPSVTITQKEYDKLLDDSLFLSCLRNAGVDNWDGYDYAQDEYNALIGEDNG